MANDEMSLRNIPLTIIVAATPKNGIGKDGALPWPMLKKEMAYFARITKRVPLPKNTGSLQSDALKKAILDGTQQNAVIMGRRTWESIPGKFRPLKGRTNVVISSQSRERVAGVGEDVVVAPDILKGLEELGRVIEDGKARPVGRAFVVGGERVYKAALELEQTKRVLLTRIQREYECDTFFPELGGNDSSGSGGWERASLQELRDFVQEDVPEGFVSEELNDETVEFEYQLYERV